MGNALVTTVLIYKVRLWVVKWLLQATQLLRGRIHLPTWLSLLAQLYQVSGRATGCLPREVIQEGQGLSWVSCCPSWATGGQESSLAFPLGIWKINRRGWSCWGSYLPKAASVHPEVTVWSTLQAACDGSRWLTAFAVSLSQSLTLTQVLRRSSHGRHRSLTW